jgi:hypothetical protein
MLLLSLVVLACIVVVLAGRAHSRHLDRLEQENTWISFNNQKLRVVRQSPNDGMDKP